MQQLSTEQKVSVITLLMTVAAIVAILTMAVIR